MATSVASLNERLDGMNDHRMMTVKEVAAYLQVSTTTAYRLTERGELPALKVGGGWRFNIKMIDRWRFEMQEGAMANDRKGGRDGRFRSSYHLSVT
jgi:excisionase family DNA binding protein